MGNSDSKEKGQTEETKQSNIVELPIDDESRWAKLQEIFQPGMTANQFSTAIEQVFKLNNANMKSSPLLLTEYIKELSPEQTEEFQSAINAAIGFFFQMPTLFEQHHSKTKPIRLLTQLVPESLTLTKAQIACLVSAQFLCAVQTQAYQKQAFPDPTFTELFLFPHPQNLAKLQMFLSYFLRISNDPSLLEGELTITRGVLTNPPSWKTSEKPLQAMIIKPSEKIEDQSNHVHADFANKYIGGGVLQHGCVQEEILFATCPELLCSMIFVLQ